MEKRKKGMSAVNLAMMALGTVVGGSFFLGSGVAIRAAGPAILISYVLGGIFVFIILFTLSEMTVADPAPGSFYTFAKKAYGPCAGFVVGWVYWTGIVLAMSSEAIALSILIRTWLPHISLFVMGLFIIVLTTLLNLLGADKLSKMESGLSFIKVFAVAGFIVLGAMIIFGILPGVSPIGLGALKTEALFPSGIGGIAGSMLIVIFAYSGFEIIGLAASETADPHKTVPKAIRYTVFSLLGLYIATILVLLPLIPTNKLSGDQSPLVLALSEQNITWAGSLMNFVLTTAIFSTMLASMFGLGRTIRSLAEEGNAPSWLMDHRNIPFKGILFSGAAMLVGLCFGFLLPKQVYVFLVSSGGFSLLFTYLAIILSHYKFRKKKGCPPAGNCQLPWFPFTSWFAIIGIIAIIASMPLIEGQQYGLFAGILFVALYVVIYQIKKHRNKKRRSVRLYQAGKMS